MKSVSKVSIKVVLHRIFRLKDKEGRYPVKLQVTYKRVQRQYTIPKLKYTPEEFAVITDSISKSEQRTRNLNRLFSHDEKKMIRGILLKIQQRVNLQLNSDKLV